MKGLKVFHVTRHFCLFKHICKDCYTGYKWKIFINDNILPQNVIFIELSTGTGAYILTRSSIVFQLATLNH